MAARAILWLLLALTWPRDALPACSCSDGTQITDADCLDSMFCKNCVNCDIPCCSSTDRWARWTISAPWAKRLGHEAVAMRSDLGDRMVVLGGLRVPADMEESRINDVLLGSIRQAPAVGNMSSTNYEVLNDVWESSDGATWREVSFSKVWPARAHFGAVASSSSIMYVFGGLGLDDKGVVLLNDVWRWNFSTYMKSRVMDADISWTLLTASASWTPRGVLGSASLFNKFSMNMSIIVMVGGIQRMENSSEDQAVFRDDVWMSGDGLVWSQVTQKAPWGTRIGFSILSHGRKDNEQLILLGGSKLSSPTSPSSGAAKNDVWASQDGMTWSLITPNSNWRGRQDFAVASDGRQLIVAGGRAIVGTDETIFEDVYASSRECSSSKQTCDAAGMDWLPSNLLERQNFWGKRYGLKMISINESIVAIGGVQQDAEGSLQLVNDVWVSQQRCRTGEVGPRCSPCQPGTFSFDEGFLPFAQCKLCEAGKKNEQFGQSTCNECPAGTFSPQAGMTLCSDCKSGTYQDKTGRSTCEECPAGQMQAQSGMSFCSSCIPQHYCPPGSVVALSCPDGSSYSGTSASSSSDCRCLPGYSGEDGRAPCKLCPPGTYQSEDEQSSCLSCPERTNSSAGATSEEECIPLPAPPPSYQEVHVQLRILISASRLNSTQEQFRQAIGAAIGVPPSRIVISSIQGGIVYSGSLLDIPGLLPGEEDEEEGLRDYSTVNITISVQESSRQDAEERVIDLATMNIALQAANLGVAFRVLLGNGSLAPEVSNLPTTTPAAVTTNVPNSTPLVIHWFDGSSSELKDELASLDKNGTAMGFLICLSLLGCCACVCYCRSCSHTAGKLGSGSGRVMRRIQLQQLPLAFKPHDPNKSEWRALTGNNADMDDLE